MGDLAEPAARELLLTVLTLSWLLLARGCNPLRLLFWLWLTTLAIISVNRFTDRSVFPDTHVFLQNVFIICAAWTSECVCLDWKTGTRMMRPRIVDAAPRRYCRNGNVYMR
jgi:hypothetical protein